MTELPPLPENCVLLTEVGSTAHGTSVEGQDDLDLMGIVVEPPQDVFFPHDRVIGSVMQRTQPEGERSGPGDVDRTLHPLRKFLRLAASGNPSIMMVLWAPVQYTAQYDAFTTWADHLHALSDAFVGRHIIPRYRGYMQGQAQRLLGVRGHSGHGKRGSGGREELISAHGYDTKYAMHCARLGFQCMEILETGKLELPMKNSAHKWLRKVREGEVPFDEWWRQVLTLDRQLDFFRGNESIPPGPDRQRISDFAVQAHVDYWGYL